MSKNEKQELIEHLCALNLNAHAFYETQTLLAMEYRKQFLWIGEMAASSCRLLDSAVTTKGMIEAADGNLIAICDRANSLINGGQLLRAYREIFSMLVDAAASARESLRNVRPT